MRVYAIGDIHGQLEMLRAAHALIAKDRQTCGDGSAPIVHLGDYVDRGPDSAGVIQFLIDGLNDAQPWRFLLGNHDRMFRMFLDTPPQYDQRLRRDLTWLHERLGGMTTLASYGVIEGAPADLNRTANARVPTEHRKFLDALEPQLETDDLVFAHAGIRPGIPLADQTEDDLIWIRSEFLDDTTDHGKLVVHGHTPVEAPMHCGNRINLDTGAGYGRPLTAAVFEGCDCWILTPFGRLLLPPHVSAIP